MRSRKYTLVVLFSVFLAGLSFGRLLDARNLMVAQADTQSLATIRAARGTLDMIQYDMERAGYSPFLQSHQPKVHVTYTDKLELVKADAGELAFRSADGADKIVYVFENSQITRIVSGSSRERLVLAEKISNFKVNQFRDGKTINMAFWYPVGVSDDGETVVAPGYAHFVKTER
jgi:hypothetical protein